MTGAVSAARFLRGRTLVRALRAYGRWVGRAIGWTTVVYLLGFGVVMLIAGVEFIAPLPTPLPGDLLPLAWAGVVTLALLYTLLFYRTPPVTLNRRDLYRLALAPVPPLEALEWPLAAGALVRVAVGAAFGAGWSLVSAAYFALPAPWAAPGLVLLLLTQYGLAILSYVAKSRQKAWLFLPLTVAFVLALVGFVLPAWGLTGSLVTPQALSLVLPLLSLVLTWWAVRAALEDGYPPRFAAQSFVLNELRALSLYALMTQSGVDQDARRRLLAQLHDKPGAIKPRRSLRAPPPAWGALGALAWRTTLTLYRRPLWVLLGFVGLVGGVLLALPQAQAAGILGLAFAGVLLGKLLAQIVGAGDGIGRLPLSASVRTLGRTLPGMVLLFVTGVAFGVGFDMAGLVPLGVTLGSLATLFLGLVLLEKLSVWLSMPPQRFELLYAAALFSLLPGLVLGWMGAASLTLGLTLGMFYLLLMLDV